MVKSKKNIKKSKPVIIKEKPKKEDKPLIKKEKALPKKKEVRSNYFTNLFKKKSGEKKIEKDIKKTEKKDLEKKKEKITFNKKDIKKKLALKKKKEKVSIKKRKHRVKYYIESAGLDIHPKKLSKRLFNLSVIINLIISFFLIIYFSISFGYTWEKIFTSIISLWVFAFVILVFLVWGIFYFILDLRIYKRNLEIEEVLPDFLQLAASNIKAGMTIDRALWYAVRPRFGVLAKEIEIVAKQTMSGKDLKEALKELSSKYEAPIFKRSISLLIEGIEAGGEIGELLIRIASNIKETKLIKQEMAANVTTYVIFISFASLIAAPILFGLSGVLIQVIQQLGSTMGNISSSGATMGMALSFKGSGVSYSDFRIFVFITLAITSFFSAAITATIKKGDIKAGFKYIPIFMITAVCIYLVAQLIFDQALSVFF